MYPGALPKDDVPNLLKLFLSKDPDSTMRSYTYFFGGYADCSDNLLVEKYTKGQIKCDDGFVWDQKKVCYAIPNIITNASEVSNVCQNLYDGSANIEFKNDEGIERFMNLLRSGKI